MPFYIRYISSQKSMMYINVQKLHVEMDNVRVERLKYRGKCTSIFLCVTCKYFGKNDS